MIILSFVVSYYPESMSGARHSRQVGSCNSMKLNKLQNSIFHIRYTVLQLIDSQHIAETLLSEPAPSRSIPRSKTPIAQFGDARDTPFFIFRRAEIFARQAPQPENTPLTAHPPARAVHKSPHTTPCAVTGSSSSRKHLP